ncbi:FG-GAP repeat domain-containing protein [Glaciecola siphonariae]|uniref:FG-GAP repeat domain-containing protein n=1 Tax=Glaciecola siphonariae TaxID=521012 RepID=A0ABV9LX24_9ALTE
MKYSMAVCCLFLSVVGSAKADYLPPNSSLIDTSLARCDTPYLLDKVQSAAGEREKRFWVQTFVNCEKKTNAKRQETRLAQAQDVLGSHKNNQKNELPGKLQQDIDRTAPTLVGFSINKPEIDVTDAEQEIRITVRAFDDGTGPAFLFGQLNSPFTGGFNSASQVLNFDVYREAWSPTSEEHVYEATSTVKVSSNAMPGQWSADIYYISDKADNYGDYIDADTIARDGFTPYIEIKNTNEIDLEPPTIIDFSLSSYDVDVTSGTSTIFATVTAYDEAATISSVGFELVSPEGFDTNFDKYIWFGSYQGRWEATGQANTYKMTIPVDFDSNDPAGEWGIRFSSAEDTNNNFVSRYDLPNYEDEATHPISFMVTNLNELDSTPPELISLTIVPKPNDPAQGDQYKIRIRVKESSSSLYASFSFNGPGAAYKYVNINRDDWERTGADDTYEAAATITFLDTDPSGIWAADVNIGDAKSVTYMIPHQLNIRGFAAYILHKVESEDLLDYSLTSDKLSVAPVGTIVTNDVYLSAKNDDFTNNPSINLFGRLSEGLSLSEFQITSDAGVERSCSFDPDLSFNCTVFLSENWETAKITIRTRIEIVGNHTIFLNAQSANTLDNYEVDLSNNRIVKAIETPQQPAVKGDFNGDGRADLSFRLARNGKTYVLNSQSEGVRSEPFGRSDDIPLLGDFDGDGFNDIALRRPSNATWYVRLSSTNTVLVDLTGDHADDVPVPADYDGDGITDFAVRNPSSGVWTIQRSSDGSIWKKRFGLQSSDIPTVADYDGDGMADIAIRRVSNQTWYILESSTGQVKKIRFGIERGDVPVPADYDGDGKADIAVYRPRIGNWFILSSENNTLERIAYGTRDGDIPVASDYDDDGKADIAFRRPSTHQWFIRSSSDEGRTRIETFGSSADAIPLLMPIYLKMQMMNIGKAEATAVKAQNEQHSEDSEEFDPSITKSRIETIHADIGNF